MFKIVGAALLILGAFLLESAIANVKDSPNTGDTIGAFTPAVVCFILGLWLVLKRKVKAATPPPPQPLAVRDSRPVGTVRKVIGVTLAVLGVLMLASAGARASTAPNPSYLVGTLLPGLLCLLVGLMLVQRKKANRPGPDG